jgi:hypothetical protein
MNGPDETCRTCRHWPLTPLARGRRPRVGRVGGSLIGLTLAEQVRVLTERLRRMNDG